MNKDLGPVGGASEANHLWVKVVVVFAEDSEGAGACALLLSVDDVPDHLFAQLSSGPCNNNSPISVCLTEVLVVPVDLLSDLDLLLLGFFLRIYYFEEVVPDAVLLLIHLYSILNLII